MSDPSPDEIPAPDRAGPSPDPGPVREMTPAELAEARARFVRRPPTWVKLWSAVILTNLGGFLVAIWVARLVRGGVDSMGTETALLFGYYAVMAVAAFVDALLLDEVLFKGAFRRTHLQGRTARHAARSDDVEGVAVTLQRSTVSFPLLLLVAGAITYNVFNLVNRDFDVYHRRVGKHISALTHGERTQRIEAIEALSIRREPEILAVLKETLRRDDESAAWAAWALGRFSDLPSRRPLIAPLWEASQGSDPVLRTEALIALARLQHRAVAPALHEEIERARASGEPVDPRLLFALGSIQTMSSVDLLEDLLHRGDLETQAMAAWALAQHRDQRGGRAMVTLLENRLPTAPLSVRCAIVHALGILADERSNLALSRAYDEATPLERGTVCERRQISLRPDGDLSDRYDLFVPQDTFDMKVVASMAQMRATSPDIRTRVEPWLERQITDEGVNPAVREACQSLLAGIRQGRDDAQLKSVEEALGLQ
jgi:hypothetical protein